MLRFFIDVAGRKQPQPPGPTESNLIPRGRGAEGSRGVYGGQRVVSDLAKR